MKVMILNGSPKQAKSTSQKLADALKRLLVGETITEQYIHGAAIEFLDNVASQDALIFLFPLYVDGVPASVVQFMEKVESHCQGGEQKVYAVVNCGFFEGKQNRFALQIMENWCRRSGMIWGRGLGIGGGGMLPSIGDLLAEKGPAKNIAAELKELAKYIKGDMQGSENVPLLRFVSPAFPRKLYILAAHIGWRQQLRKNGLKVRDLTRQAL